MDYSFLMRTPVGTFNNKAKQPPHPTSQVSPAEFKQFLREKSTASPDALTAKDIRQLIGYHPYTIVQWICQGKLKAVRTSDSTLVAKKWLIDFIAEYTVAHPGRLSKINSLLIEEYTANALSLSICPPDKNQFTCVRDQSAYRWCVTANEQ